MSPCSVTAPWENQPGTLHIDFPYQVSKKGQAQEPQGIWKTLRKEEIIKIYRYCRQSKCLALLPRFFLSALQGMWDLSSPAGD